MQSGIAPINGANIYYETAGSGFPLVFVHAGIADSRMWDDQFPLFAQHFHVVRFDMRGFGQTPMVAGEYAHYEDIRGLLDYLKIDRAFFVGCSMGGAAVINLALEYPQRVAGMVLVCSNANGFEYKGERPQALLDLVEEINAAEEAGDIDRLNEAEVRLWVDGCHRSPEMVNPAVREKVRLMNGIALRTPPDLGQESGLDNAASRFGEIKAPLLIIVGELDVVRVLAIADELAAQVTGAQKVIMNGTAHVPNLEMPEEFNKLVLGFLSQQERA